MYKAFQFRIDPTMEQARLINQSIGCSRFVFNYFLTKWQEAYRETKKGLTYPTCSRLLTQLKKEREWLREVDSTSLQNSLKNLADLFVVFSKNKMTCHDGKANGIQYSLIPVNPIILRRAIQVLKCRGTKSNFQS